MSTTENNPQTSPAEEQFCPLCMELIEFDDLSFYPCQCGYQICRFCWHRIRTNENGLCPACRKLYASSPDRFQPVTIEHGSGAPFLALQAASPPSAPTTSARLRLRRLVFTWGGLTMSEPPGETPGPPKIICRFCWHRIRTNENGLCPACRKLYASSPDRFQPVTIEQHKQHRKQKKTSAVAQQQQPANIIKRNLVDLRVIQKNLIFVIGLSLKISSVEELKKFVYFGKYGKILKVVVSSNGQTGSAYITYAHSNDALRAIQKTNNIVFDNKLIKTSLGTTKYCSYYLKSQQCTKSECMYLHSLGDDEASFTKEDMLAGKHTEYERRLVQEFISFERSTDPDVINPDDSPAEEEELEQVHVTANSPITVQEEELQPQIQANSLVHVETRQQPMRIEERELHQSEHEHQHLHLHRPLQLHSQSEERARFDLGGDLGGDLAGGSAAPTSSIFDPFNETNQIFEELISRHSRDEELQGGRSRCFQLDPHPPTHPPPHHPQYFYSQPPSGPPGFNWLPPAKSEPEWSDPAIIFSQLYPAGGASQQMQQQQTDRQHMQLHNQIQQQQQNGYQPQYSMFPRSQPPPGFHHH